MSNAAQSNPQHNNESTLIPESPVFDNSLSPARTKLSDEASIKLSSPTEGKQIGEGIQQINNQRFNITLTENKNREAFSEPKTDKLPINDKSNDDQLLKESTKKSNEISPPFAQPIFDENGKFMHFEIQPDNRTKITKPDQTGK